MKIPSTVPRPLRAALAAALAASPLLLLLLAPVPARAQSQPTFAFAKPEEVKAVEWKVQAKGGFLLTTGNARTTNATVGASASRKEGNNKLALDAAAAYGRSSVRTATMFDPVTGSITQLGRQSTVTTNNWLAKGRYDRFFTANNSAYAAALAAADRIAGKSFAGGGQIGYSRQLYKSDMHLAVAEIGYDFSYESYVAQPGKTLDAVTIHSARLFVGETLKLSAATGATASVEAFFNLNKEGKAIDVSNGQQGVGAFKDTRITGKLGLTTTLWKALGAGFGFTLKYDQNPAPLPVPSGVPAGVGYAAGFQPFADKVDTQSEVTLIYTFL